MGVDQEIIFMVILLPSTDSRRIVFSCKPKYVHEVLVNILVKLAQEKCVVKCTDRPYMTIAVDWDVKPQMKQTLLSIFTLQCSPFLNYLVLAQIWI